MTTPRAARCTFIPPWLVERVDGPERAARDDELRASAPSGDAPLGRRPRRPREWSPLLTGPSTTPESRTTLPGTPARSAGEPETGDVAVDEAATGIEATLAMFPDDLARDSYDGAGAPVSLTVHYGSRYNNAFWDGTQLVFGDGDGRVFERFTKPVDVLAHEFSHAVVEHTADLTYRGQSGALNESVADAFASCLKQRLLGQDADEGDWLIGQGIFTPSVQARALRDMAAPGTAYDDPEIGADPQVGHMDDYVETTADNGGVHLNSGIPNKAFQLAAVAIGGTSISGAGRVWYDALRGRRRALGRRPSPPSRRRPSQPPVSTPTPSRRRGRRSVSRSMPRRARPTRRPADPARAPAPVAAARRPAARRAQRRLRRPHRDRRGRPRPGRRPRPAGSW